MDSPVWRNAVNANCLLGCPAVAGGLGYLWKCTRKFSGDRHCRWSQACRCWSVDPSRKLRRFESFTCHHALRGRLTCGTQVRGSPHVPVGYPKHAVDESVITAVGRRPVTCVRHRAGRTRPHADLWRRREWGCNGGGLSHRVQARAPLLKCGDPGRGFPFR